MAELPPVANQDSRHPEDQPREERLQKVLARAGVDSRRNCEKLIARGVVRVNGQVMREPGSRVDPCNAIIHVEGRRVFLNDKLITVALNKPAGVVSTMSDPRGRPTLADYVTHYPVRLFHVGRLDTATEGLILLTNDGELAHRLAHPSYEVSKTYSAIVAGRVGRGLGGRLRDGVELEDGPAKVDRFVVKQAGKHQSMVELDIHIGRNRIVRRLLAEVGHPVQRLVRTRIGQVALTGLAPGQSRRLNPGELADLMKEVGL